MKILDPCSGSRMFWFDRKNQDVVFGDIRSETIIVTDRSHGKTDGKRVLNINPDIIMDFTALPFADEMFNLVVFDPPHIKRSGKKSWLAAKYGCLKDGWEKSISAGFLECFRVLRQDGVLVFKWSETHIKAGDVLRLSPVQPLFGNRSAKRTGAHWYVFIKPNYIQFPEEQS